MVNTLVSFVFQVFLVFLCIWIALALLGLKWQPFKSVQRGYASTLKGVLVGAATWLWAPEMQREGGGHLAQASSEYEETDEWEDLDEDGLP